LSGTRGFYALSRRLKILAGCGFRE